MITPAVVSIGRNTRRVAGITRAADAKTHTDGHSRSRYIEVESVGRASRGVGSTGTAPFDQIFLHYPRLVPESVDVLIAAAGESGIDPAANTPSYAHPGDAGADLLAAESVILAPGARATIGTGVAIALPDGYAAFVMPRSGLAARHGITIVNGPGTVDAGYRGEIRVTVLNTDTTTPYAVEAGDRIAQLVVMPVSRARFVAVSTLPGSHRGDAGFGSTGYRAHVGHSNHGASTHNHSDQDPSARDPSAHDDSAPVPTERPGEAP